MFQSLAETGRPGGVVVARLVAVVAEPARPEVFAPRRAEEAPEAEALVGQRDRPVRIAFAGGDGIAEPRDQQIADLDLRRHAVDAVVGPRDADRGDGRLAVGEALLHRGCAGRVHLLGRDGAVVEAPVAGRARRHRAGEPRDDRMRLRHQIVFALAVAVAGRQQDAGRVDAQVVDLVLRPAAAAGGALEEVLGGELAAGAVGDHVALEVGLAAEQAEAVLDLPFDCHVGGALRRQAGFDRLGAGLDAAIGQKCRENGGQNRMRGETHVDLKPIPPCSIDVAAEIRGQTPPRGRDRRRAGPWPGSLAAGRAGRTAGRAAA